MTEYDNTLNVLRKRINDAQTAQTRAQVQHENAVQAQQEALAALKGFGVSNSAEAAALLESLEADLASEIEKVKQSLEEAGA